MSDLTQLRFHILSPPYEGKQFELSHAPVELGRDQSCFIQIEDKDNSVSRQHVRFHCPDGTQWLIEDLNSTNYTMLEHKRLQPFEKVRLPQRAEVQFGNFVTVIHIVPRMPDSYADPDRGEGGNETILEPMPAPSPQKPSPLETGKDPYGETRHSSQEEPFLDLSDIPWPEESDWSSPAGQPLRIGNPTADSPLQVPATDPSITSQSTDPKGDLFSGESPWRESPSYERTSNKLPGLRGSSNKVSIAPPPKTGVSGSEFPAATANVSIPESLMNPGQWPKHDSHAQDEAPFSLNVSWLGDEEAPGQASTKMAPDRGLEPSLMGASRLPGRPTNVTQDSLSEPNIVTTDADKTVGKSPKQKQTEVRAVVASTMLNLDSGAELPTPFEDWPSSDADIFTTGFSPGFAEATPSESPLNNPAGPASSGPLKSSPPPSASSGQIDALRVLFEAFGDSLTSLNDTLKQVESTLPGHEPLKQARLQTRQSIVRLSELRGLLGL